MVNKLYPEESRPVPFWIDTLCVPRKKDLRNIAIANMRNIYKMADKVLVFDAVLSEAYTESTTATELLARICSSTWARRLWTFQEAIMARTLYYQFADHAIKMEDILKKWSLEQQAAENLDLVGAKAKSSSRIERLLSLFERLWLIFCFFMGGMPLFLAQFFADWHHYPDPVFWGLLGVAMQSQKLFSKDLESIEESHWLQFLADSVKWRWTSRIEDETICLADILGRDIKAILATDNPDERMKLFIFEFTSVPAGILFIGRPRMDNEPCRWMPRRYIGGTGDSWMLSDYNAQPTDDGLVLHIAGFLLRSTKASDANYYYFPVGESLYRLNGHEAPPHGRTVFHSLTADLAVIVSRPLEDAEQSASRRHSEFTRGKALQTLVLGALVTVSHRSEGFLRVRFERPIRIEKIGPLSSYKSELVYRELSEPEMLPESTKWLVR
jgi:hypothetical protein